MKLLIFGATGGTGQQLVKQSIHNGHETSVFVRNNIQKLDAFKSLLTVYRGDVLNYDSVETAVQGQDAVVVALGVIPGKSNGILSIGTSNIIKAMEKFGVKRLIVETGAALAEDPNQLPMIWKIMPKMPFMRDMFGDKEKQEQAIKASNLDWIIVRPANLTNLPLNPNYNVGEGIKLRTSSTISRADVADFMIKQATSSDWIKKAVIIESFR